MMAIKSSTMSTTKKFGLGAVAALLLATPLLSSAAEPAGAAAGTPSCKTVMVKTKEFGDAPKEQIEGICKNNRNSPAYWSCMNTRIDKGQSFANAGMRCNKTTASVN